MIYLDFRSHPAYGTNGETSLTAPVAGTMSPLQKIGKSFIMHIKKDTRRLESYL